MYGLLRSPTLVSLTPTFKRGEVMFAHLAEVVQQPSDAMRGVL